MEDDTDASEPLIVAVDPRGPEVRDALRQYLADVVSRVDEMTAVDASHFDDVGDYTAPNGRFLLVYHGGAVIGCGAVRTMTPTVGEVKRMWIRHDARGDGIGDRLLTALEETSRALGHTTLRLDTNGALVEALALYRKHGFEPIERYNDNLGATHFLGKAL